MTDESYLEAMRSKVFEGHDVTLYLHIGHFISWFAAVELQITFMLARALSYRDLDNFDLLVKGMDARVKCERLRKACKKHRPLGPNLKTRLSRFEDKVIPLRNKIAHSWLMQPEDKSTVYFGSLSKMPYEAMGMPNFRGVEVPESTTTLAIFEHGLWLSYFSDDLMAANLPTDPPATTFEIVHPLSPAPQADRQQSGPTKRSAKPDKPPQKPDEQS